MSIAGAKIHCLLPSYRTQFDSRLLCRVRCSDKKPGRGFGAKGKNKKNKVATSREEKSVALKQRNLTAKQSGPVPTRAPGLNSQFDRKSTQDIQFEERLEAVRRSALDQKKAEEDKEFGAIDYDAPIESDNMTIGLGTKIGVGVAVVVFGLVFAFGDFLPSGSDSTPEETAVVPKKLSEEQKTALQSRLRQYEATLSVSPRDPSAVEGAAVTFAELGEYKRASSLLEDLTKEKPNDPEVFRLLGEVKYELKDYEGSISAYRSSAMVSKSVNFEALRGLTNALLAAKKPDEAVKFLLASRESLNAEKSMAKTEGSKTEADSQPADPVQVDLLLGKAYSDWGHVSDALAVYDQLISSHPNDFRGYLAKGIILKENGDVGGAERMFIQARFFAPENAKALVDRYTRR